MDTGTGIWCCFSLDKIDEGKIWTQWNCLSKWLLVPGKAFAFWGFARAGDLRGKVHAEPPASSSYQLHSCEQVHVWPKGPNSSWRWVLGILFESGYRLFWAVNCWRNVWSTQLTSGQVALKRIWVTWTDCREAKSCGLVPNFPWNIFMVAPQGTWISLWIFSINDQSVNH